MDVLEEEEAIALVKRRIRNGNAEAKLDDTEEVVLQQLTKEVGYLPLALAQAAAYIAECHTTIAKYLEEYRSVTASKLEENLLGHQCDEIMLLSDESAIWLEDAENYEPHIVYLTKTGHDSHAKITTYWCHDHENVQQKEFNCTELKGMKTLIFPKTQAESIKIRVTEEILLAEKILSLINYNEDVEYPKSAATTWMITMERIRRQSPKALIILHGCAYLAPNQIPKEVLQVFLTLISKEQKEIHTSEPIDKLISTLCGYSMLKDQTHQQVFNIHPVVQEVIRSHLQKQSEQKKADPKKLVEQVCVSLNQSCPQGNQDMKTIQNRQRWIAHLEKTIKCYREIHKGIPGQILVAAISLLGDIYLGDSNDPLAAQRCLEEAKDIVEKHYKEDKPRIIRILTDLSAAYGALGDPRKQYKLLSYILEIQKSYYNCEDHAEMIRTLVDLGAAEVDMNGNVEKQLFWLRQAQRIQEKCYSKDHIGLAKILGSQGIAYLFLGEHTVAKKLLKNALEIQEKHSKDKDQIEISITLNDLSHAYWALGEYEEQKKLLDRSLEIQRTHYGDNHYEVARTRINLSSFYEAKHEWEKAIEQIQIALPILKTHYSEMHPVVRYIEQRLRIIKIRQNQVPNSSFESPSVKRRLYSPCSEDAFRQSDTIAEDMELPDKSVIVTKLISFYTRSTTASAEGARFWLPQGDGIKTGENGVEICGVNPRTIGEAGLARLHGLTITHPVSVGIDHSSSFFNSSNSSSTDSSFTEIKSELKMGVPGLSLLEKSTSLEAKDKTTPSLIMMSQFKQRLASLCENNRYQFTLERSSRNKLLIQVIVDTAVWADTRKMKNQLDPAVDLLCKMVMSLGIPTRQFKTKYHLEMGSLTIIAEPMVVDRIVDLLQEAGSIYLSSNVSQVKAALFYNNNRTGVAIPQPHPRLSSSVVDDNHGESIVTCAMQ